MYLYYRTVQGNPHEAAWELLAAALDARGTPLGNYTLCRTALGKPYFAEMGAPHFSLAHTKTLAVCAISAFPIGMDAERTDRAVSPAVRRRFLGDCAPAEAVTAWTRRESYGKLTGEGVAAQTTPFDETRYCYTTYTIAGHTVTVCHTIEDTPSAPQEI